MYKTKKLKHREIKKASKFIEPVSDRARIQPQAQEFAWSMSTLCLQFELNSLPPPLILNSCAMKRMSQEKVGQRLVCILIMSLVPLHAGSQEGVAGLVAG